MTIKIRALLLAMVLGASLVAFPQSVNNKGTKEQDTQVTAVNGAILTFQDSLGTQTDQFEMLTTGAPASVTVTIDGCMRGGKCNLSIGSSSSTTGGLIPLTMSGGPYDFFRVNVAFTGGTNPTLTFNRTGTAARSSSGASNATITIASGSAALATGSISNGVCASAVTAAATGAIATDSLPADFSADPSGTTGYNPAAGAQALTIYKWVSTGPSQVNFKVCNFTAAPITPGAVTLNWRVVR